MMGLKNREEVGEVLAGWLAISGGQVTTSCSEESKLPIFLSGFRQKVTHL
jgi:hypothetical protein